MNTDGSNRRVLFTDLSSSLDGLTITSKYIYYSDKNKRSIMRLNRDGTNHTSVGTPDFPHVIGLFAYDSTLI
nr:low-density lipoprotein receptor-related protein 6-like [Biomphalaria glabrata]